MKQIAGFDDLFAVVSDTAEPAVIDPINQLLTAGALSALMALSPIHLQAKGTFIRFSKRFAELTENDLDHLFDHCLRFVDNLNFG